MRAERSHQQRAKTRHRHDGVGAGLEAVIAQHQHAGHVLAGQGDEEQGQGDAQQGVERERRHGEKRSGELQAQSRQIHAILHEQKEQAQHQDADDGITRAEALEHHISHDQQAGQHRINAHAAESLDAELQQDAREQTCGHARRNQADQALEPTRQPQHDKCRCRNHVGAHRFGIRRGRQRRDQKRRRWRGPGGNDGLARQPAQDDPRHAHADGNRPHPRGRQLRAQARDLGGLEHQNECAAVVDDDRDQAGYDGMGEIVPANR